MLSSRSYARAVEDLQRFIDEHWQALTDRERLQASQSLSRLKQARDLQHEEEVRRKDKHV